MISRLNAAAATGLPTLFCAITLLVAPTPVEAQDPPTLAWTAQSTHSLVDERLGYSLSFLPDVTGDGQPDVVAGVLSSRGRNNELAAGRADIYNGVTGAPYKSVFSPTPDINGYFGRHVVGLDDIDGDGWGDFVVGAFPEEPVPTPLNAGAFHVFSGRTSTLLRTQVSPNAQSNGWFGAWLAVAGDMDNDGRADLIVTAPGENGGATFSGNVYVFNAVTGALITTISSPNPQDPGYFGYSVAPVPDIDGDGILEFVVGAQFETTGTNPSRSGVAYIYDGRTGGLLHALVSPSPAFHGFFGFIVDGIPDVDGDGKGDVVIGARRELHGGTGVDSGRAHIFSGGTGTLIHSLDTPSPTSGGDFGWNLAGLPDVTGDGRGDVAVGAFREFGHNNIVQSGSVYLYNGATGALRAQLKGGTGSQLGGFGNHLAGPYKFNGTLPVPLLVGEFQAKPSMVGRVHKFLLSPDMSAADGWVLYE